MKYVASKNLPSAYNEIEKLEVETIVVKSKKLDLNTSLDILITKLNNSGAYDRRDGFCHIRGKNCHNSTSPCSIVKKRKLYER